MLTQIYIRDLATIEALTLNFSRGTTMITGETGAGKSIFIEAIELALGGRASANLVRHGKEKAEITLCFDISNFPNVITSLKEQDLYQETSDCIIRRVITADGRSRCYVNGTPATVHLTKELGEQLFHLHSQHEQQVLLNADKQRETLDRYADHAHLVQEVKILAEKDKQLKDEITALKLKYKENVERKDFLTFQLEELETVNLKKDEWQQLEVEHHRLSNAEELLRNLHQAITYINGEEPVNIVSQVTNLRRIIEHLQKYEPQAVEWMSTLNSIFVQLSELETDFKNYVERCDLDPEKLQQTEARVTQIFNLARKHKVQPKDLSDYQIKLQEELQSLDASEENLAKLKQKLAAVHNKYQEVAAQLTESRTLFAKKLEQEITAIIRSLSLPHSEFRIVLEEEKGSDHLNIHGRERILFYIKTNPDQPLQPLAKVISGGELSRLSLAAHLALANKTNIPTLIFDEVDTGLSGATAEKIGKLLRRLGGTYQVFCITHQPQVAAYGHHHLLVEKKIANQKTHTALRLLDPVHKAKEIARMLGGEKITQKTLEHAQEILESV